MVDSRGPYGYERCRMDDPTNDHAHEGFWLVDQGRQDDDSICGLDGACGSHRHDVQRMDHPSGPDTDSIKRLEHSSGSDRHESYGLGGRTHVHADTRCGMDGSIGSHGYLERRLDRSSRSHEDDRCGMDDSRHAHVRSLVWLDDPSGQDRDAQRGLDNPRGSDPHQGVRLVHPSRSDAHDGVRLEFGRWRHNDADEGCGLVRPSRSHKHDISGMEHPRRANSDEGFGLVRARGSNRNEGGRVEYPGRSHENHGLGLGIVVHIHDDPDRWLDRERRSDNYEERGVDDPGRSVPAHDSERLDDHPHGDADGASRMDGSSNNHCDTRCRLDRESRANGFAIDWLDDPSQPHADASCRLDARCEYPIATYAVWMVDSSKSNDSDVGRLGACVHLYRDLERWMDHRGEPCGDPVLWLDDPTDGQPRHAVRLVAHDRASDPNTRGDSAIARFALGDGRESGVGSGHSEHRITQRLYREQRVYHSVDSQPRILV